MKRTVLSVTLITVLLWACGPARDADPAGAQPADQAAVVLPQYDIIGREKLGTIKHSVDLRLEDRISEEELAAIANGIRDAEPQSYDRTFICYYLPGMTVGSGAWATTHFDPDLQVRILGVTALDAAEFLNDNETRGVEVGRWLDDRAGMGARIVIYEENSLAFMETTYPDGSRVVSELAETPSPSGRRFESVQGSAFGDHWLVDAGGALQIRDDEGLIATLPPSE